jgi:small subunit ribosomal protein S2
MAVVTMRELLEAGVHFGHQTRRWNPKMRRFIFTERGGIYIIDLQQTLELLEGAHAFVRNVAARGGTVLFVGTKKQCQDAIAEQATRVGMPYVNHRWLGGLLTNWRTMASRIERLHDLRRQREEGQLELLPPKERMAMLGELEKLETNLGGVADMKRPPDAVVVVDLRKEQLAIKEARRLGMSVVGLVDTNCDPDDADYVIPGNDDAIRSCNLVLRVLADGIAAGAGKVSLEELATDGRAAGAAREAPAEAPTAPAEEAAPEAPAEAAAAVEESAAQPLAEASAEAEETTVTAEPAEAEQAPVSAGAEAEEVR